MMGNKKERFNIKVIIFKKLKVTPINTCTINLNQTYYSQTAVFCTSSMSVTELWAVAADVEVGQGPGVLEVEPIGLHKQEPSGL